jgi:hypothetical protein
LPRLSELVTTIVVEIMPIIKPVSLKLWKSSSRIRYVATVLRTSSN